MNQEHIFDSNARNYIYNDSADCDDTFEDGDQAFQSERQEGTDTTNERMRVIMSHHVKMPSSMTSSKRESVEDLVSPMIPN
jgi:hypothetical protein